MGLVEACDAHEKLKVMQDKDLLAGMPEGTCVCVCVHACALFGVCVFTFLAVLIHVCLVQT